MPLLHHLLGESLVSLLAFHVSSIHRLDLTLRSCSQAFRELCTIDLEDESEKWATKKVVKDLLVNYPQFEEQRTILVDDTPRKMRDNIPELCIPIPSYCATNLAIDYEKDDTLLHVAEEIIAIRTQDPKAMQQRREVWQSECRARFESRSHISDWKELFPATPTPPKVKKRKRKVTDVGPDKPNPPNAGLSDFSVI